jgi:hypothetical protein
MSAMISALYSDNVECKLHGATSTPFSTSKGVKQGCPLSPLLFNICLDAAINATQLPPDTDIIAYADDIAIFSRSRADAITALQRLNPTLNSIGLRINFGKTKFMVCESQRMLARDTAPGHQSRSAKIQSRHRREPVDPTYYHILRGQPTIDIPRIRKVSIRCPFVCSYKAHGGKNRTENLLNHLQQRHHISPAVRKVTMARNVRAPDPLPGAATRLKALRPDTPAAPEPPIVITGQDIKQVATYKYLGYILHDRGLTRPNLNHRITKARTVMATLSKFWASRHVRTQLKSKISKSTVLPTLLYGHECWSLPQEDTDKLRHVYHTLVRKATRTPPTILPDGTYIKAPSALARHRARVPELEHLLDAGVLRLAGSLHRSTQATPFLPPITLRPQQTRLTRGVTAPTWNDRADAALHRHNLTWQQALSPHGWTRACRSIVHVPLPALHNANAQAPSSSDSE